MFKLSDKVSLITGAGSGIGESISRLFGWYVLNDVFEIEKIILI